MNELCMNNYKGKQFQITKYYWLSVVIGGKANSEVHIGIEILVMDLRVHCPD